MATETPSDIAYSGGKLSLHMDLMYCESPPGLHLLHCLRCVSARVCVCLRVRACVRVCVCNKRLLVVQCTPEMMTVLLVVSHSY